MTYFNHISTLSELRALYRKLAIANHPDKGGDVAKMAAINTEYDEVFKKLQNGEDFEAKSSRHANEMPEDYRKIIEVLINIHGLELELCGSWIWISGKTRKNKQALKEAGCFWAAKKLMWYWRPAEHKSFNRKSKPMQEIRNTYGSVKIDGTGKESRYEREKIAK